MGFQFNSILIIYLFIYFLKGENFNAEEVNELLQTCLAFTDPDSPSENPHILYKYYVNELVIEGQKE